MPTAKKFTALLAEYNKLQVIYWGLRQRTYVNRCRGMKQNNWHHVLIISQFTSYAMIFGCEHGRLWNRTACHDKTSKLRHALIAKTVTLCAECLPCHVTNNSLHNFSFELYCLEIRCSQEILNAYLK